MRRFRHNEQQQSGQICQSLIGVWPWMVTFQDAELSTCPQKTYQWPWGKETPPVWKKTKFIKKCYQKVVASLKHISQSLSKQKVKILFFFLL